MNYHSSFGPELWYNQSVTTGCWTAFRSGVYTFEGDDVTPKHNWEYFDLARASVNITYLTPQCLQYVNTTTVSDFYRDLYGNEIVQDPSPGFRVGECQLGRDVICKIGNPLVGECRLNIRMSAAITLTICLTIKATFMVILNVKSRRKIKTSCLTFGDVIAASALDIDLQIPNECLLNADEGNRHDVKHTCHKHCKETKPSRTGDSVGHCQKCTKFNIVNKAFNLPHPCLAIKHKRSLLFSLGFTALLQMITLIFFSVGMLAISIWLAVRVRSAAQKFNTFCFSKLYIVDFANPYPEFTSDLCSKGLGSYLKSVSGSFGGFNTSASLSDLPRDNLSSEIAAFAISNGAQLLFSALYLLLIYNVTIISIGHDWGIFEKRRQRLRCTIVKGSDFEESYYLQLPKKIIFPIMALSAVMHWLLGQSISTTETIVADYTDPNHPWEHSQYSVCVPCVNFIQFITLTRFNMQIVYATYAIWLSTILMMGITVACWWTFTYRREGFMPQMYGSIRACCAATTELEGFSGKGIQWGDRKLLAGLLIINSHS